MYSHDVKLTNYMPFKKDFLTDIMDWAVENLFYPLWNDEKWMKCAKGGNERENYKDKPDMFYIIHIFSGVAMALKVIDYKYRDSDPDDIDKITLKLKRSIFGYLFHDYNKLENYEENIKMDKKDILNELTSNFIGIMKELNLEKDDVYTIAFSTETGTQFHANSNSITLKSNLSFENSFSRLADTLSSRYMYDNPENENIVFNNEPLIPSKKIQRIKIASTPFIMFSSILKYVLTKYIEEKGFYLWSTLNSIYYVSEKPIIPEKSELIRLIKEEISKQANLENGIKFTDRKINISSNKIGPITEKNIIDFISDNNKFKQILHLENIELHPADRENAESYSNKFLDKIKTYSINFHLDLTKSSKKEHSIRDYLIINDDFDKDNDEHCVERKRTFIVRYVQLQTRLKDREAERIREKLRTELNNTKDLIKNLLPKSNKDKSVLLIPLIILDDDINWDKLFRKILNDLNKTFFEEENNKIISYLVNIILGIDSLDMPEVPDKKNMSMINGYPAKEKGTLENLFGIGTNNFNNRLTTSAIANGKIDEYSIYEFSLRKTLALKGYENYSPIILFMAFPGAVPFMNMAKFLSIASEKDNILKVGNIRLSIEDNEPKLSSFKLDSSYFIYLQEDIKTGLSRSDTIKIFNMCLDIAWKSKLHLLLTFSNNIFYEEWNETVKIEMESPILNGMKWNKIRCNKLIDIRKEMSFFLNVSMENGKIDYSEAAKILDDFIANRMSLNFYVHKHIFDNKYNNKSKILNKESIDIFRNLVYEKRGDLMKKVIDLGNMAASLYKVTSKSSASDRGWMLRESIEVLEKMKAVTNSKNLNDLTEFVSGHLYKGLERLIKRDNPNSTYRPDLVKINEFTKVLLDLLNNEFKGKIPAGITRSYLIDAFEIEYKIASDSMWNQQKKEGE